MTSFIIYDGMIRTRLSQSAQICCCSFLMFSVRDECHAVICFFRGSCYRFIAGQVLWSRVDYYSDDC
jgi:hypothetical protein